MNFIWAVTYLKKGQFLCTKSCSLYSIPAPKVKIIMLVFFKYFLCLDIFLLKYIYSGCIGAYILAKMLFLKYVPCPTFNTINF